MSSVTHAHPRTRHAAEDGVGSLREELSELKDTIQLGAHDATDNGRRVLRAAGAAAREAYGGLRQSAVDARDRAGRFVSERPMTSVALAAAAGAVLMGALILWRRRG